MIHHIDDNSTNAELIAFIRELRHLATLPAVRDLTWFQHYQPLLIGDVKRFIRQIIVERRFIQPMASHRRIWLNMMLRLPKDRRLTRRALKELLQEMVV